MFSFFKKKHRSPEVTDFSFLGCDIHSHLIPGIDDGAQTEEDSLDMIRQLSKLGYKKLITTPHVHGDYYKNDSQTIEPGLALLQNKIAEEQIDVTIEAAAEYYLDGYFTKNVSPYPLRSFGNKYVLVEVSMLNWPLNIEQLLFDIQLSGYTPILAHPERYNVRSKDALLELKDKEILMQLNILAMFNHYGPGPKKQAEWMLQEKLYDFCATDAHHIRHLNVISKSLSHFPETIAQLKDYGFRNAELL